MKNESRNIGFLISTVAFGLVALTAIPLRVYQYFHVIEPGTGFFISTDATVYALYGLLGAGLICSMASALICRREIGYDRSVKKRPGQGIFAVLACVSMFYEVGVIVGRLMGDIEDPGDGTFLITVLLLRAQVIFGLLAAVYILLVGIGCFTGKSNGSEFKILSAAPMAWLMFRLILCFTTKISFTKVSELTLELFMLAFMLMFFGAYAQLNSKIESKGLDWKVVGYGLPAAVFGLCCFVPRLVMVLTGNESGLYENGPVTFCDLGLALYILSVVFTRVGWVGGNADAKEENVAAEAVPAAETEEIKEEAE